MLTTMKQGDFMKLSNFFKPITSILSVKAVGSVQDVTNDLSIPDGKSISVLLQENEQKTKDEENNQEGSETRS